VNHRIRHVESKKRNPENEGRIPMVRPKVPLCMLSENPVVARCVDILASQTLNPEP
jgi:hypothetical protein